MSTLAEIEKAADALSQEELRAFKREG